jgi:hypothetical protein
MLQTIKPGYMENHACDMSGSHAVYADICSGVSVELDTY